VLKIFKSLQGNELIVSGFLFLIQKEGKIEIAATHFIRV